MSTMIALLLVLSTLAGCAGEALGSARNAPQPQQAPAAYTVKMEVYEHTFRDGDGTELAECSYEIPVLLDGDEEVEAFSEPFATWQANGEALAQSAKEDRAFRAGSGLEFFPYTDELRCTVYQTDRLVSVAGAYYTFGGGAHGNTSLMSWNFDLETGEFFNPALLDVDTKFHEAVVEALIRQAGQRANDNGMTPEEYFWEDYKNTLDRWSSYAVSFDSTGMTVGFSPYELACYAAGPQVFQIPYEDLRDYLGPHGRVLLGME